MAETVGREQREIPVLVWEWVLQEQGVGPAGQTVQTWSREIFLVLLGNGKQEQDLIKMYLFINYGGNLIWMKNTN